MAVIRPDPPVVYSSYVESLDETAKTRYREKLAMLGGVQDPYKTIQSTDQCLNWLWPNVKYPDIFNYFVTSVSTYTKQQLKAYESLKGYRYFVDGWIQEVFVWLVDLYPLKLMLVLCNTHKTTTVCSHPSARLP